MSTMTCQPFVSARPSPSASHAGGTAGVSITVTASRGSNPRRPHRGIRVCADASRPWAPASVDQTQAHSPSETLRRSRSVSRFRPRSESSTGRWMPVKRTSSRLQPPRHRPGGPPPSRFHAAVRGHCRPPGGRQCGQGEGMDIRSPDSERARTDVFARAVVRAEPGFPSRTRPPQSHGV